MDHRIGPKIMENGDVEEHEKECPWQLGVVSESVE